MVDPADSQEPEPPAPPAGRGRSGRLGRREAVTAVVVVAVLAVAAVGADLTLNRPQSDGSAPPADRSAPSADGRTPASGTVPALIALIDGGGALATADASGNTTIVASEPGTAYGFPAWSPDGSRIAVVATTATDASIAVFPIRRDGTQPSPGPTPTVVYSDATVPPFYLYWSPDGRRIAFLATEADGISLRVAPADGSAPLDHDSPGTVIRRGAPLYFDWVGADRLLVHVGNGSGAFLGEVGLDGAAIGPALAGSGDFRSPMVGADGRFVTFVRDGTPSAELVVAAHDRSAERAIPVFGPVAAVFDPSGATVASIAPDRPAGAGFPFPTGPLRLVDAASGATRTLLDGSVIAFFWSPDGRTIAAIRLQDGGGSTDAARPIVLAAELASPSPDASAPSPDAGASVPGPTLTAPPNPELHLLFVDAGDGTVRSDRVVRPTAHFVNQLLSYFDQYALSHRLWSPDSRSLLLPEVGDAGAGRLVSLAVDGTDDPGGLAGVSGFWSP